MGECIPENIEVTDAMIRAGAVVLAEEDGICGMDVAPAIAHAVFMAMWQERDRETNLSSS